MWDALHELLGLYVSEHNIQLTEQQFSEALSSLSDKVNDLVVEQTPYIVQEVL